MTTPKADVPGLTEVLTIPQVAKRAGWTRQRMWNHLVALNRELNGLLLVNIARGKRRPRWTVSVASLKFVHSAWFKDPTLLDELQRKVESLSEENAELRLRVFALERRPPSRPDRGAHRVAG